MQLHELLPLSRKLFVLDTEATGNNPEQDRIIQIAFEEWGPEGLKREKKIFVNPQIPIPPKITKLTGIIDEMVKDAYTFAQMAGNVARGMAECDFAGQTVRFDLRIISAEMDRAKQDWNYVGARIIDSNRLEALAIPRDLSTLYEKYTGEKLEGAHDALIDVVGARRVIEGQMATHAHLPRTLDEIHAKSWEGYIDVEGRFRLIEGVAIVNFGKWKGKPMRVVERDYWKYIQREKFSNEIKQLAFEALMGRFPDDGAQ